MSENEVCPSCGAPRSPNAPMGLCPNCLLAVTDAGAGSVVNQNFEPPTPEELNAKFPQLQVLEMIGRGGMGVVYKARQTELDRIVALKILPPGIGDDPEFAERFAREARALAKLNHPNIVTLYEFGSNDGLYFFLMEYVDGVNLRQAMSAGRFTPEEALAIVPPVCEALQFAHEQGIVHRDIKPENLLLDKDGQAKIADFGLAKMMGTVSADPAAADDPLHTNAGGTPRYMAPEQSEDPTKVDHRADIYAMGVVLYELLTGETPKGSILPLSKKAEVDARLDEVVLRALAQQPELRFASVADFQTEIQAATQPEPNAKERRAWTDMPSLGGVWMLVALAAVILAFINPWGVHAWYVFSGVCAVLGVILGWWPNRRLPRFNVPKWVRPTVVASTIILVFGVVIVMVINSIPRPIDPVPIRAETRFRFFELDAALTDEIIPPESRAEFGAFEIRPAKLRQLLKDAAVLRDEYLTSYQDQPAGANDDVKIRVDGFDHLEINAELQNSFSPEPHHFQYAGPPPTDGGVLIFLNRYNNLHVIATFEPEIGTAIAHFSNGFVNLFAISDQPSAGEVWSADGSHLLTEFPDGGGRGTASGKKVLYFGFRVRTDKADLAMPEVTVDGSTDFSMMGASWSQHKVPLHIQRIACPLDATSIDLKFGIAGGEWESVIALPHTLDRRYNHLQSSRSDGVWSIGYNAIRAADQLAYGVRFTADTEEYETRLVYVMNDGRIVEIPRDVSDNGVAHGVLFLPEGDAERVVEFRLERRRYQFTEFKNISIEPGHLTAPSTKNAPPPPSIAPVLGPVIEFEIESTEALESGFYDLDSARFASAPPEIVAKLEKSELIGTPHEDEVHNWMRRDGVDVVVDSLDPPMLLQDQGVVGPLMIQGTNTPFNAPIEQVTPQQLQEWTKRKLPVIRSEKHAVYHFDAGFISAFQTREGTIGVLQISEQLPKRLRVRYRVVEN